MKRVFSVCLAAGALAAAPSCSSSESSAKPRLCLTETTPAAFDPMTPTVSFARDVVPIFSRSCVDPLCHGDVSAPNSIYLNGGASATYGVLVGKASTKLPTMAYVLATKPTDSFLMRKIDATHCSLDAQCVGGTCGDAMPGDGAQLAQDERDTVRRWIAQGAKND